MIRSRFRWLLLPLLLSPLTLCADDWPQFRGPDRNGVSKEKGLSKAWPKEGPKLAWTFKNAGSGVSSFAVVKDVLYTLGTRDKAEIVLALDAKTGKELWTAPIGPIFNFTGNVWGVGPRSTPTVAGNFLYALGGQGILVCLDISAGKGKEVWRKDFIKDFNGEMMTEWGYSESPLIDGDHLICTPGGKDGTLAALNKKTGALVWRSKDWTAKAPYSSAIAADIHGVRQYIQLGYIDEFKGGVVAGVEAKSGKLLWSESVFKKSSYAMAPTPIVKDDLVYVTTGYGGGCHLFQIGKNQKATDKYAKKTRKLVSNTHGGVVLLGASIYGHSEREGWICQDLLSGDLKWSESRELECSSGATTAAEGMLYLYTDKGEVGLVGANPEKFNLVSSFTIPERSKIPTEKSSKQSKPWAYPVVANGQLFLRDHDLIFAYEVRGK